MSLSNNYHMSRYKGFHKNRFEYDTPRMYVVVFESGFEEEVMATSSRDARLKTNHLSEQPESLPI